MSYGTSQLKTLLKDSSITDLLTNGAESIWYDVVIPDEKTGSQDSTINFYRIGPVNFAETTMFTNYSINCRAGTMPKAEAIALAVRNVVNPFYSGGFSFKVSVLSVIPPLDTTDNYNAPLDVKAWGQTFD